MSNQPPPYLSARGQEPPPGAVTQRRTNPDSRPLPEGWVTQFNEQYGSWFYINTRESPPRSSWVHPLGPPGPQSVSGYAPPPGPPQANPAPRAAYRSPSPYAQGPPPPQPAYPSYAPQPAGYAPPYGGYPGYAPPPQWGAPPPAPYYPPQSTTTIIYENEPGYRSGYGGGGYGGGGYGGGFGGGSGIGTGLLAGGAGLLGGVVLGEALAGDGGDGGDGGDFGGDGGDW